ncbi:ATP-binding protein [Chitinimonas sp. BJB300]|uniref:ATP-binding protein n=1 Tax=Chitinimonas sp. BJB300 TaxID=1559339 RepID=UPI0011129249|nr:ATP-binding protein [Chitinimonas sp. BJB300]TSJ88603.1 response regulator [Chitinimonas sp. BJB300]
MNDKQTLHVLLVEDSRTYAMPVKEFIEDKGHRVTHSRSGEDAVQCYLEELPDVILMGVIMQGIGGIEATRLIRQIKTDRWVSIIMMTSLEGTESLIEGLEAGADEYLIKPIRFDVLDARIRALQRIARVQHSLQDVKQQLVQTEKMASIGQLAAGIAHEINNPIGFVYSNIGSLERYLSSVFQMLDTYEQISATMADEHQLAQLASLRKELDIEFLKEDIPNLITESKDGISRVKNIVQDLKDFSHVDDSLDFKLADLHKGIDSTLNIVSNEIKYKAEIIKEYGVLPEVECVAAHLNQVFMNLAINAAHAIGETRGKITIRTGRSKDKVWITFSDTGCGIPNDIRSKVFDPFFTTKPIGKGTGLGLSLSYGIIQKHHGTIEIESEVGKGTTFHISLPIRQTGPNNTAGNTQ